MARLRRPLWLIPVTTALLVAACSGSLGSITTISGPSSLATTSTVPAFTTITVFPTTTTTTAAPEPGSLEANRLLWESSGIDRYRMTITVCGDFCPSAEVWVDGERVVEIPLDREHPHRMGFGDVSWLFDVVEGIPAEWLSEIEYDAQWGYPTRIAVNSGGWTGGWGLRVEDFQPTTEPLPEYEYPADTYSAYDLRHEGRRIDAVVEGTVIRRGAFVPSSRENPHGEGWPVEVDLDTIWYQRAGTPPLLLGAMEVVDPPVWSGLQPPTSCTRKGSGSSSSFSASDEATEGVPAWYASWALQRTDAGLDFLGFFAERYGFDADLPELCTRGPSGEPRDAEAELALLVRWAEEFDHLGSGEPARLALRRACAADDPAGGE